MPRARKMLSDLEAPYIRSLMRQMETRSKATLARWALGYAEEKLLPIWQNCRPEDPRPRQALDAARAWLAGTVKLPPVRAAILACHAAAREAEDTPAAQCAARAIGHCTSTVHVARHAIGLALYGAPALAYEALGADAPWAELEKLAAEECRRMLDALRAVSVEDEPNPAKIGCKR